MIVPFPPLGAVKDKLTAVVLNTVAVPIVGAIGFVVIFVDALDATDVPPELVAETVNECIVLAIKPETVIGEDVPDTVKPELLITV